MPVKSTMKHNHTVLPLVSHVIDSVFCGWVDPSDITVDQPGLLRDDYTPGDIGFDPFGLRPSDPEEFEIMATKELQNGRLAMLTAAGFMAQELVDGQGILEHFSNSA